MKFFSKVHHLMAPEDACRMRYGPKYLGCPVAQSDPKTADNWLTEQFSPSDVERIE
jgi:hypothetical protein